MPQHRPPRPSPSPSAQPDQAPTAAAAAATAAATAAAAARAGRRRLLPLALGLTAALAAAGVADGFMAPLPPPTSYTTGLQRPLPPVSTPRPSTTTSRPPHPSSSMRLWARRRKKGDDADFERFNLDELRDESRFEPVDAIDPEMFRPSKMEYYVTPPEEELEAWDVTDTRYIAVGMDRDGEEVFREARLPNCYLHLAWARRSYLDKRSPVSVWWDYALVREDLQGNRGNLFGMNASSASLVKAFIELDPYQKLGVYKSLRGFRWRPLADDELLWAPRLQWAIVALDKEGGLPLRKKTREAHLAYMRASQRVVTAGPLFSLDDEEGGPIGSLVIFNAEDEADAAAFVDNDPYAKAGLFASTFVTQLAELDVSGQHLDRQWEKFQLEENRYYDPVHDLMRQWGLVKEDLVE